MLHFAIQDLNCKFLSFPEENRAAFAARSGNENLLFDDLQDLHGAGLDTDAAGDALGSSTFFGHDHNLHGAGLDTLAAADALLLVDHVNTGLGVLGNGLVLAGTHALAALDANIGLGNAGLIHNLDAAEGDIIYLIKSLGTSLDALQAGHALLALLNSELLHTRTLLYVLFTNLLYICIDKKATKKISFFHLFS